MYLEHYGLAEPPFRITPHTDFFFSGANRGATLEALIYAITHDEGIVKISGEVGSGKTMLCRVLMEHLPESVVIIYLANPSLSREDILYALADELAIEVPDHSRAATVMRAIQERLVTLYAEGKQVVVLIDEAHAMPRETLEEIRLLSNLESNRHKLLQLVMFGQPELNETLARADMRQLRERITHNFTLGPLIREDISQYIDFRMRAAGYHGPNVFSTEAIKLIAKASEGLTRRINILADKALLASYAAGTHQVDQQEVRAAIRDSEFSTNPAVKAKGALGHGPVWAIGGAASMLVLIGIWQFFAPLPAYPPSTPTTPPVAPTLTPLPQAAQPAALQSDSLPPSSPQASTSDPSTTSEPAASASQPVEIKGRATPLLDKLLAESQSWLETVSAQRWFLQLNTTNDTEHPEHVESFLVKARNTGLDMGQLRVYLAQNEKMSRYGVIFGDFASRQDAVEALATLPSELKRNHPYPRKVVHLRSNNNKTRN